MTFSPSSSLSSGVGKRHPIDLISHLGPGRVPNSFPWGHLSTAGKGKAGYDAPFSPRCQCTEETLTKSSRALSFLAMVTRCA